MKQQKITEIANICYAIVSGEFAMFCNPKNRGTNFSWNNFPDMQEKGCPIKIWMYMTPPKEENLKIEIEKKAAEFGQEIATTLIKRAEFV